ncbi:cobalamin (vitamin B12) biosynthesis protein precorrin-3B biosynthesis protein CobG [Gluconobacter frateurii M-2]|nr:cobalamin (vitamin B12) biosynthesis protein precorrin-3B biosynthesis protein CobG [Gluconobacter frateurii M-2]
MSDTSLVRGWCPDLFAPMQARDGFLVRIRPPIEGFEADQVRAIALMASDHGNGTIELTNRGNLQLRGFSLDSARLAGRTAIKCGLADQNPARERRRAVLVSPLAGYDPACHPDTAAVARKLQAELLADDRLASLPGKFGWGVDGGGLFPVGAISADIVLQARPDGWSVLCGGFATKVLDEAQAIEAVLAISFAFACQSEVKRPAHNASITKDVLERVGFLDCLQTMAAPIFTFPVGKLPGHRRGVGVPFGRLSASDLYFLAEQLGKDRLRITPWRSVVMPENTKNHPGFITEATDLRLRIEACIGVSGCERAIEDVAQTALALASDVPPGCVLHVSGCVKGCAHPRVADMTLIARNGRYDVVRNGCTKDTVSWADRNLPDIRVLLSRELKEIKA